MPRQGEHPRRPARAPLREPAAVTLRHNRDYLLLQSGQLLSDVGRELTTFAYPLLILAVSGSPSKAGLALFARVTAVTVCALPAGVVADRWNRRWLMLAADAVRALAVGGLAVAILLDALTFWGSRLSRSSRAPAVRCSSPHTPVPCVAWFPRRSYRRHWVRRRAGSRRCGWSALHWAAS